MIIPFVMDDNDPNDIKILIKKSINWIWLIIEIKNHELNF